jgi:serine protease
MKQMMKSRIAASLTGLTLLAAAGCGGTDSPDGVAPVGQAPSWEAFRAQVFVDPEGVFIVNGDTPIHDLKLLREFYEQYVQSGQLAVHQSRGVDVKWSDTQKRALTYCVSTAFGARYDAVVQAMASATGDWEAVSDIRFIHVGAEDANCTASNTNVLFDVRPVSVNGQYLARAFFPDSPRSSRNILIDNSAFGNLAPWTLTGIMRHELGHTLGFRHEHTRPESGRCFEDNNWRPLTPYDSASVMHYPHCAGTQEGDLVVTPQDARGAATLYGAPGSQPPPSSGGTVVTATASGSVARNQEVHFNALDVVAGTPFRVVMTGSGDPDLYVRFGARPTTTRYHCRPFLTGASESCELTVPAGESSAHIMVRGYTSGSYNLDIRYTRP